MKSRFLAVLIFPICLVGLIAVPTQARASYPGLNGRLALGVNTGDGNVDVYSVLANGDDLRRLTDSQFFDGCPAYSPDGKWIAYCAAGSTGATEIWEMKANGKEKRQVTFGGGSFTFPNYSPDGSMIAFGGQLPSDSNADIFVVNRDGAGLRRLTTAPGDDLYPAWSPDGRSLVFISSRTGTPQVWVMDAEGGNQIPLTTDPAPKGQLPDWSPDGTRIAFESNATGGGDIYVMNADGSSQTRLTTNLALDSGPRWSPDGTQIAFLSRRDLPAARNVYVMNADGTEQHAVHPGGIQYVPAWQPLPLSDSD